MRSHTTHDMCAPFDVAKQQKTRYPKRVLHIQEIQRKQRWQWICLLTLFLCTSPLFSAPDFAPGQLLVRFTESTNSDAILEIERTHELKVKQHFKQPRGNQVRGALVLYSSPGRTTAHLRASMLKDPAVAYAEPNYIRTLSSLPNDPDFSRLWGLNNTGQSVSW